MDSSCHTAGVSPLRVLLQDLHRGEAEAIALASDMGADIVLFDEREGRWRAAEAGIAVSGVLGILLRAKRECDVASIQAEIRLLRDRARFFVSPALEKQVLASAGE